MIYLTSDIHGDFRTFQRLLRTIRFSDQDHMYILGDVMDKGKEPLRLLTAILQKKNMTLIKGNHEYLCERYLSGIIDGLMWDACGGTRSRQQVDVLTDMEKKKLLIQLQQLPVYIEIRQGEICYFLTHSGLHADFMIFHKDGTVDIRASVQAAVVDDQEQYLFSNDIHYIPAGIRFDKRVIVGHYPTLFLPDWERARIYRNPRYIDLDTGNERREQGGKLACLNLENKKEIYV